MCTWCSLCTCLSPPLHFSRSGGTVVSQPTSALAPVPSQLFSNNKTTIFGSECSFFPFIFSFFSLLFSEKVVRFWKIVQFSWLSYIIWGKDEKNKNFIFQEPLKGSTKCVYKTVLVVTGMRAPSLLTWEMPSVLCNSCGHFCVYWSSCMHFSILNILVRNLVAV